MKLLYDVILTFSGCPFRHYGIGCLKLCNCAEMQCSILEGKCPGSICMRGYGGERCDIEGILLKTFLSTMRNSVCLSPSRMSASFMTNCLTDSLRRSADFFVSY